MYWSLRFRARQSLKGNLWALPLVGVIAGALVGAADSRLESAVHPPQAWQYSASTASTLLAAIAGAMVALTGFVLTVSVLVVQMATDTFSARYMRLFYRDMLQKAVLGVLVGTMTFAFSLLRRIEPDSVPDVGVTLAAGLVVISLLLFVIFLDRFIHRLRPVAVAALVARAGKRAFRESVAGLPDSDTLASIPRPEGTGVHVAPTPSGGSVQAVAIAGLVDWAEKHDCTLVIRHPVGEFVPAGSALFELHGASPPTAIGERRLRGMVALGVERTIEQDPGFAIRIMADIAIKALSAAINDPTTAVQVMDHLEDTLLLIGQTDLAARTYRCDAPGPSPSGRADFVVGGHPLAGRNRDQAVRRLVGPGDEAPPRAARAAGGERAAGAPGRRGRGAPAAPCHHRARVRRARRPRPRLPPGSSGDRRAAGRPGAGGAVDLAFTPCG